MIGVLSTANVLRARALEAVARRSRTQRGVVLAYHGIGEHNGDRAHELVPSIARRDFERHLTHLRAHYDVVPASTIVDAVRARRPGSRFPVALTFDDDLASHVTHAAPALDEHATAATFFLCGASLEAPFCFWWEDLQALYDEGRLDPALFEGAAAAAQVHAAVRREPRSLRRLAFEIERLEPRGRAAVAAELRAARGEPPRHAGLRAPQVRALADAGFEVGFHTRHHPVLTTLADEELSTALTNGRAQLEQAADRRLATVAYPHGKADERIAEAAARAGFDAGFTGTGRPVRPDVSPWLVNRLEPAADVAAFAVQLARAVAGG